MFKAISSIYNSSLFTRLVFLIGIPIILIFLVKNPQLLLLPKGIGIAFIILFILIFGAYTILEAVRASMRVWLRREVIDQSIRYIIVYSKNKEKWNRVMDSEIRPLFAEKALVLDFDEKNPDYKLPTQKKIFFAYSLNEICVYNIQTKETFYLWKQVRKAAYGYPTKLNNTKIKIQKRLLNIEKGIKI